MFLHKLSVSKVNIATFTQSTVLALVCAVLSLLRSVLFFFYTLGSWDAGRLSDLPNTRNKLEWGKGEVFLIKINCRSFCFLGEWHHLTAYLLAYVMHNMMAIDNNN